MREAAASGVLNFTGISVDASAEVSALRPIAATAADVESTPVVEGKLCQSTSPSITLQGARIAGSLFLDGSRIATLDAIGLQIGLQLTFIDGEVTGEANFYDTSVELGAFFLGSQFHGIADFSRLRVGGEAYFCGASFFEPAVFRNAQALALGFYATAQTATKAARAAAIATALRLEGLRCQVLDLKGVAGGDQHPAFVDLSACRMDTLKLDGARLSELVLRRAAIAGSLDLRKCIIATGLDLEGATLGSMALEVRSQAGFGLQEAAEITLVDCLYRTLDVTRPEALLVRQNGTKREARFARQSFVQMSAVLRAAGREAEADQIQIHRHRLFAAELSFRRQGIGETCLTRLRAWIAYLKHVLWGLTALYGYSTWRPLVIAFAITCLASHALTGSNNFETPPGKPTGKVDVCGQAVNLRKAAYYAFSQLLPLPQASECQPLSHLDLARPFPRSLAQPFFAFLMLGIVKLTLLPIAIASFAGVFKRIDK